MSNDEELTSDNTNLKFKILDTPTKSQFDKKEYRVIRLKNGLTACLASDIATAISGTKDKMAAACLSISVGSFNDPKNIPGMAHFLEHMVFMGSEKYPTENDFSSFITSKGGFYNAETGNEFTQFYFSCLKEDFFLALDKFCQFFIAPLMLRNSINREIEAIDTEYQMSKTSEYNRKIQLVYSFMSDNVPINRFVWGNSETLKKNIPEDILYEQVHEFRKTHYSADKMTLAVQGTFPITTLEKYVVELFSKISSNQKPVCDFSQYSKLFDTAAFKKMYYVEPITKTTEVDLVWCLPSLRHKYHTKPGYVIGWILGDEGVGSLLSYLKKKVWALSLMISINHASFFSIFGVNISLTDEGLKNLHNVIESVFSYIQLMQNKGPQKQIFKEIQTLCAKKFEYAAETNALTFVCQQASSMHTCIPTEYLTGESLLFKYDPEDLQKVVDDLVFEKVNILVSCNELPKHLSYNKKEKWFETIYCEADVSTEQLDQWKNPKTIEELHLPPPNQFIPTNFVILEKSKTDLLYPEKIINDESFELWYRQDQKFKLPHAVYNFYLINPISKKSAFMCIQMEIYTNLINLMMRDELYPATLADIGYYFSTEDFGISIIVCGFNEKLEVVLDIITKYIIDFNTFLTNDLFEVVKEDLVKSYYNGLLNPDSLASDCHHSIIQNQNYSMLEKYNALFSLTIDTTKKFASSFFRKLYIKALIQGNVSKSHAIEITKKLVTTLNYHPVCEKFNCQVKKLPKGESTCVLESFNKNDLMSTVLSYYQSDDFSLRESVIIELIVMIIDNPVFDTLRTKEQLGYSVFVTTLQTYGILGFVIIVNCQKTKYSSQYVNQRIDNFIEFVVSILKDMPHIDFEQRKNDLIKVLECPDLDIYSESSRNWYEIKEGEYFFNRTQDKIQELERLHIEDIYKWWINRCFVENDLRKLSVQVVGFDSTAIGDKEVKKQHEKLNLRYLSDGIGNGEKCFIVKNIEDFKNTLTLFPIVCKHSAQTNFDH